MLPKRNAQTSAHHRAVGAARPPARLAFRAALPRASRSWRCGVHYWEFSLTSDRNAGAGYPSVGVVTDDAPLHNGGEWVTVGNYKDAVMPNADTCYLKQHADIGRIYVKKRVNGKFQSSSTRIKYTFGDDVVNVTEMRATQLRLDAELEIPAGEEQALAEFAHQLQKHVSRLRERADAKRAEAAALRGSDEDGDQLERDAEDLP